MKLPASVQEIADVIGSERALLLIGQLPRCYMPDKRKRETGRGGHSERVIMYVPKNLKPDHQLVRILGWNDAQRLVAAFGGEVFCPSNCRDVYRSFRDASIRMIHGEGVPIAMVAEWFGMTERRVRQVLEIPQVVQPLAANDNRANHTQGIRTNEQHSPASHGNRGAGI